MYIYRFTIIKLCFTNYYSMLHLIYFTIVLQIYLFKYIYKYLYSLFKLK